MGTIKKGNNMIRKLKSLGLALVAVLAMSAVVASAAQAVPQSTCSSYPCTSTGSSTKGSETFTIDGATVTCDSHFVSSLSSASSTRTITPTYTGCEGFGFTTATVNVEGCTYLFHATEKVAAGVYKHHVDIVCPSGKSIKMTGGTCGLEVKPQTGKTTVQTTNLAGGTVTIQWNTIISVTITKDGFGCVLAGLGTRNGAYHGDVVFGGAASVSTSGE
jgi:hypothetical protein